MMLVTDENRADRADAADHDRRAMRLHHKRRRIPTRRSRPLRGTKQTISTQQP